MADVANKQDWDFIKNQPVAFGFTGQECGCGGQPFCQLVEQGDDTPFQFDLAIGDITANVVANGTFDSDTVWTKGTGWTIAGGKACHVGSAGILSQSALTDTKFYQITFTVLDSTAGSIQLRLGANLSPSLLENKTYTFFLQADGTDIEFATDTAFDGCIDNVTVLELCEFEIVVKDNDDVEVFTIPDSMITITEGKAVVIFDWSVAGLDNDCYTLCVKGDCYGEFSSNLITNGDFSAGGAGWATSGSGWSVGAGVATFNIVGPGGSGSLVQVAGLTLGICFDVTFTITNITGTTFVTPMIGTGSGTSVTTNGTFTQTIEALTIGSLEFAASTLGGGFDIDDIVVVVAAKSLDETCTPCYTLQTTHDCSLLLTWNNRENAFGFNYDNDFTFQLRVDGKLRHPIYPKEREMFEFSDGTKQLLFSNTKKQPNLVIREVPEYIHSALSISTENDIFAIDGVEHITESTEYEPIWRNTSELAPSIIEVQETTQLKRNYNCEASTCCLLQGENWNDDCVWCDNINMFN